MKLFRLSIPLLVGALLLACTASTSITLSGDGGGACDFRLRLEKPFVDYLLDIGEAGGLFTDRAKAVIFDLAQIEKKLKRYDGVTIARLRAPSAGELDISFTFKNLDIFTRPGDLSPNGSLLAVSNGERKSIRLRLDKGTVNSILTSFIKVKGSEVEYFLPRSGETKADYYDNLDFAFDGGGALFRKSTIVMLVSVYGKILDHNGELKSPSSVRFSVPLESVLFLDKPVEYSIVYE
ncbi:MAG: hypothetical protein JXD23_06935 [Spirochaetales bacterium]|nr:hypothetical protein [Spirochaetales bacterium]